MSVITGLLGSKKFVGMIVGVVITLAAKIGFDIDDTTAWQVVALVASWTGAQGLADHAKEKAKLEQENSAPKK